MNGTGNPFEQANSINSSEVNPFAQLTPDPFGFVPDTPQTTLSTPFDIGSQTAANLFESPATLAGASVPPQPTPVTTELSSAAPSTPTPVIDLGSQSGIVTPFPIAEQQPSASVDENEAPQLRLLQTDNDASEDDAEPMNPLEAAMAKQELSNQQSIFAKLPIFEHGAVKEPIEDLNQTFEELRIAKSDDFPELEDAVRVSWDVTYGKVRKTVPTPKKTKIGEFKQSIETSKEFLDALKKDKNKSPECIIKPRITAQSKGQRAAGVNVRCGGDEGRFPLYKGIFTTLEDAETSDKVICIVPGNDGKVYEIRKEEAGTFITPSGECKELSEIRAGFTPALPPVPNAELRKIIAFFRSVMPGGMNYEAIANIYWDRERHEFITAIPKQHVTAVRADSDLSDEYNSERYLHYMDIHSHNVMPARFSAQDNADEKATRLYTVIGKLHEFVPELSVRISNGGKHLLIDPAVVFETFGDCYPDEWNDQVTEGGLTI